MKTKLDKDKYWKAYAYGQYNKKNKKNHWILGIVWDNETDNYSVRRSNKLR